MKHIAHLSSASVLLGAALGLLCGCGGGGAAAAGTPPVAAQPGSAPAAASSSADGTLSSSRRGSPFSEYALPASQEGPISVAIGPNRNAWVLSPHAIDRVTSLGAVTAFAAPAGVEFGGAIARGRDGALWFLGVEPSTQYGNAPANAIFRLTTAGALTSYVLPAGAQTSSNALVADIAAGPDGKLWYVVQGYYACGAVGSITTGGSPGPVVPLCEPTAIAPASVHIAPGSSSSVYVTVYDRFAPGGYSAVYRLSLADTILKQFVLPGASNPEGIAMGPGRELWVTLDGSNAIARIKPSGAIVTYALPTPNALPSQFNLALAQASAITRGADGALWFLESQANKIGRISLSGHITEYAIPTPGSRPSGIAACTQPCGGDCDVWFTESRSNKVAKLIVAGRPFSYAHW